MDAKDLSLEGQVAIVTGASRGIGRAIALAMADHGASVVVASRRKEALEKVAAEIEKRGGKALVVPADVSRAADVQHMVDRTVERFGRIDILVNNAGTLEIRPILETTEEQWNSLLDVNVKGPFLCTQAAARIMMRQGGGRVVNISSNSSVKVFENIAGYCVTKAALNMLTRGFAKELAPHKIRVNAIAPGLVNTEMAEELFPGQDGKKKAGELIPLGFISEPDDIAHLAVYLASGASRFMTGETIVIDGGVVL